MVQCLYSSQVFHLNKTHGIHSSPLPMQLNIYLLFSQQQGFPMNKYMSNFLFTQCSFKKKKRFLNLRPCQLLEVMNMLWDRCLFNNIKPFYTFVSSLCSTVLLIPIVVPYLYWRSIKHYEFILWNHKKLLTTCVRSSSKKFQRK